MKTFKQFRTGEEVEVQESAFDLEEAIELLEALTDPKNSPKKLDHKGTAGDLAGKHNVANKDHTVHADVIGHHSFHTTKGKVPVMKKYERGESKKKQITLKKGQKLVWDKKTGHHYGYDDHHGHFRTASADASNRSKAKNESYEMSEARIDGVAKGSLEGDKHMCASKIFHKEWKEGTPIFGEHALPDENGHVAWYKVMFEHGIETVEVADKNVEVIEEGSHGSHKKKAGY